MSVADQAPYEEHRNPRLPWGYWMVIDALGDPSRPVVDEFGQRWSSLRAALWIDRLQMGDGRGLGREASEQIEFLLAVLAALDRTIISTGESACDLFGGSWFRTAHYGEWLAGHRLINKGGALNNTKLSPEGRAILMTLAATRDPELAATPIGLASLHAFAHLRPEPDQAAIEQMIAEAEAALPPLPCRFVRHQLGDDPAVVLVGRANARMPMRETLWSITPGSSHERDMLYIWLLARADRWERWVDIVQCQSARALSEHLLALKFADEPYPPKS